MFQFHSLQAAPIPGGPTAVNAQSAGNGFLGVALPFDAGTVYWNPAGVGALDQMSVEFTAAGEKFARPGNWSFIMANSANAKSERFGFALLRRSGSEDSSWFKSFQINLPLAYGFQAGSMPVGVALKFISERQEGGGWRYGSALDAGALWRSPSGMVVGLSSLNIAASNLHSFENQTWAGFGWGRDRDPYTIGAQTRVDDWRNRETMRQNLSLGINFNPDRENYAFRCGWTRRGDRSWATFGVGWQQRQDNTLIAYSIAVD
ncbi:MAG: hypothetical protein V2A61_03215, partial [Calditrichota bacterium]